MKRCTGLRALCVLIVCALVFLSAVPASATPAEDAQLHFNADGKFRILNFSDLQDTRDLDARSKAFIRRAVYAAQPDLIVLTGDNIYGTKLSSQSDTLPAITSFMSIFEQLGVPVAIVFGNHDDENKALSKEAQMAIYNSFSVSVSYDEGSAIDGCGTYNVPIYGSAERDRVKFNIWMFDTGSNGGTSYDHMRQNQLDWYVSKSNELRAQNGGVLVPSIAFQHIVVREIFDALRQVSKGTAGAVEKNGKYYVLPDTAAPGSVLGEGPCPSTGGDEFETVRQQGDVLAIVCGHDHVNSFVVPHRGVDLICTPTAGFYSYGNEATRGARVIDLDENTGSYSTYMLNLRDEAQPEYYVQQGEQKYVKEIALCIAQSAQYGGRDQAKAAACARLFDALDAAGGGVVLSEDLNDGSTSDMDSSDHFGVFMGYTVTDNPDEAMRALGMFYTTASSPNAAQYDGASYSGSVYRLCNYAGHEIPGTDGAVNLNIGTGGNAMFFYASYDASAGSPLTEIRVVNTGSSAISMDDYPGYSLAYSIFGTSTGVNYADLNKTARGDYVYALVNRNASGIMRTQVNSTELRSACLEAGLLLKQSTDMYTAQSVSALSELLAQTRSTILRDLDDDRCTQLYDQAALTARAALLRERMAELTVRTCTITLDTAGGICYTGRIVLSYGDAPVSLPEPLKTKYLFDGWFTRPDGGIRAAETLSFSDWSDCTLYAHWIHDSAWVCGDADESGVTDLKDTAMILRYLAGGWSVYPEFLHADVNEDDVIDLKDVALIHRYLAGGWDVTLL